MGAYAIGDRDNFNPNNDLYFGLATFTFVRNPDSIPTLAPTSAPTLKRGVLRVNAGQTSLYLTLKGDVYGTTDNITEAQRLQCVMTKDKPFTIFVDGPSNYPAVGLVAKNETQGRGTRNFMYFAQTEETQINDGPAIKHSSMGDVCA